MTSDIHQTPPGVPAVATTLAVPELPWFRAYRNDLENPQIQGLPDGVRVILHDLRCVADHLSGQLPDSDRCAWLIRKSPKRVAVAIAQLVRCGLIRQEGDDRFLANWRQSMSDFSSARTKEWRERNKASEGSPSTKASPETLPMTSPKASRVTSHETSQIRREQRREDSSDLSIASARKSTSPSSARYRIDPDREPDERDRQAASDAWLSSEDLRTEWGHFRDHHLAKGTLMADWNAAWRTWLANFRKGTFARNGATSAGRDGRESNFTKAARELLQECEEREDHHEIFDLEPLPLDWRETAH